MHRLFVACFLLAACGGDDSGPTDTVYFELEGSIATPETFWDLPFPSDLRLDAQGAPDMTGYPNPKDAPILKSLLSTIPNRRGWPAMPAAYFRFTTQPPTTYDAGTAIPETDDAPAFLVDIDAASPDRGKRFPIVAHSLVKDGFAPDFLVAVAPLPGIVLRPSTHYAYVLRASFATGFEAPTAFVELAKGKTPSGARGAAAAALYAPLWPVLEEQGVTDVLVATVFTTGDEVARLHARSEGIRAAYSPAIQHLTLVGGNTYDGFCRLTGTITMPQFQVGTPPFDTEGGIVLDGAGIPVKQSELEIPVNIALPKQAMPVAGFPLYQFFHGSGGISSGLIDLGYSPTAESEPEAGKGPAYVVAQRGIASISAALPVNPERLVGASDYAYLNIDNLAAFPNTFQQGVYEQRLLTDALLRLEIPHATVNGCMPGNDTVKFDATKLVAGGQSMGGMYTNMIGAVEPRFGALVPTGAGGFWNSMILDTSIVPGAKQLVAALLGVDERYMKFLHPGLNTIALGWEIAEPMVYMARLGRYPLPGTEARHVYEPVGMGDEYFPIGIYDAAALAYGNKQAGEELWPSMQTSLASDGLEGVGGYPVIGNVDGKTRAVIQFAGDGIVDEHYLYRQIAGVKHQYACFLSTFLQTGIPKIPAPGQIGDPCPQ